MIPILTTTESAALKRLLTPGKTPNAGQVGGKPPAVRFGEGLLYIVKVETAVPAMSGDVPGKATAVQVYEFNSDDELQAVPDASDDTKQEVYNLSESESATGYLLAVQETPSGRLVLVDGGCGCPEVHEITTTGQPTAGSSDLPYEFNSVTEDVTINWDDTAAEVQAAFETHSEVVSGDVVVTGGPLPRVAIYIKFAQNHAGQSIDLPEPDGDFTDGSIRLRKATGHEW